MLRNILPKESGNVEIKFDDKNAYFELSNYTMVCRQVEGRYPNYNGVIPKNNPFKIIIDRVTLLNTLKRVSVFSNQASNLIKLDFTQNQVHVSAQDIDFSISAEEFIPCQYEGEPIKIGFKSTFLIEMLGNVDSAEVVLELADPSRAGILLPVPGTLGPPGTPTRAALLAGAPSSRLRKLAVTLVSAAAGLGWLRRSDHPPPVPAAADCVWPAARGVERRSPWLPS